MARVVLHAVAVADFAQHVEVVAGALFEPLRFEQFAVVLEELQAIEQFDLDRLDRAVQLLFGRDVVFGREDLQFVDRLDVFAGEDVDDVDRLDLVAEKLDPVDQFLFDADELERVAAHAERAAHEVEVVAPVLHPDQLAQKIVAVDRIADLDVGRELHVVGRRAQAVDARDRGDDQGVGPGQQRLGRRVPQALDLVVDRGILGDVGVGVRDIRFGLVVVEIGDEVLDRVVREKIAELRAQLGGERLVMAEHQRRLLDHLDDPRHRHRLAAAGDAQQRLGMVAPPDPGGQRLGRRRLVAGKRIRTNQLEFGHMNTP